MLAEWGLFTARRLISVPRYLIIWAGVIHIHRVLEIPLLWVCHPNYSLSSEDIVYLLCSSELFFFCEMNNCLSGNNTPLFFLLLFVTRYGMLHSPELYPLSCSRTSLFHVGLLTIPKSFKSEQKSGTFLPLCNSSFLGSKDARWYPACLCYTTGALLTHA